MKLQVKDLELFEDCYSKTNEDFNTLFKRFPKSYKIFRLLLKVLFDRGPRNAGQELFDLLYEDAARNPEYTSFNMRALFNDVNRDAAFPAALADFLSGLVDSIEDDLYMAFVRVKDTGVYTFSDGRESKEGTQCSYFISTRIPYNGDIDKVYIQDYDNSNLRGPRWRRTGIEVASVQLKWDSWEALLKALLRKSNWEYKNSVMGSPYWNFKTGETYDNFLEKFKR